MDNFNSWPLSKKYLAAHFYLSEEKPISITEAQRAQLGALHLFVSFGKYNQAISVSDLELCSQSEKKKRIEEWIKLSCLSKTSAMQKFLDLLTSLFPNWTRSRKLLFEFQLEWSSLQQTQSHTKKTEVKTGGDDLNNLQKNRRAVGKSLIQTDRAYKLESPNGRLSRLKPSKEQPGRLKTRTQSIDIERIQSTEIQNSLYSFKEVYVEPETPRYPIVSASLDQYRSSINDGNYLKHFIEDLQSHKGGNIKNTSAVKFPNVNKVLFEADFPESNVNKNFDKDLKAYRRNLLQNEFDKFKPRPALGLTTGINKMHEKLNSLKQSFAVADF